MKMQIITVVIKSEYDIMLVRQRAKKLAALAKLSITDQTRFVTGVSEIARNSIMYANGGRAEFAVAERNGCQYIQVAITDNSSEDLRKIVEGPIKSKTGMGIGISGTQKLVDYFNIDFEKGVGNIVTLGKKITSKLDCLKPSVMLEWSETLAKDTPRSFIEELQQQNQVLMQTLEKLEEKEKETQRQLEETLRLNNELEHANQELRDFAYVVSHDLKAPLRGISSLAGWIAEDYKDKLDSEGKNMLDLILGRILRMNNLIDGILQYSRVGRVKEEKTLVDLNATVSNIISMLNIENNINVVIEQQLPQIISEETRINQVFQNLICNAVKYMDKPNGEIKIGCSEQREFWEFYIADNGPGIEEKYFEKIFKIFQTLNARDRVEGTGIGLTIVKKIIELYGGRIWLESTLGDGATFYFTLKK
jgi:signal transduction histidine kinase